MQDDQVNQVFISRLKELCKSRSISMKRTLEDCELGKGFSYNIEKRNKTPSIETLYTIANYFDVSTDYLLGRTDNPMVATPLSAKIGPAGEGQGMVPGDVINFDERRDCR